MATTIRLFGQTIVAAPPAPALEKVPIPSWLLTTPLLKDPTPPLLATKDPPLLSPPKDPTPDLTSKDSITPQKDLAPTLLSPPTPPPIKDPTPPPRDPTEPKDPSPTPAPRKDPAPKDSRPRRNLTSGKDPSPPATPPPPGKVDHEQKEDRKEEQKDQDADHHYDDQKGDHHRYRRDQDRHLRRDHQQDRDDHGHGQRRDRPPPTSKAQEKLWHYTDQPGESKGPFSITVLRSWRWSDPLPRVWRRGSSPADSIALSTLIEYYDDAAMSGDVRQWMFDDMNGGPRSLDELRCRIAKRQLHPGLKVWRLGQPKERVMLSDLVDVEAEKRRRDGGEKAEEEVSRKRLRREREEEAEEDRRRHQARTECKFFQRGGCRNGAKCSFMHAPQSEAPLAGGGGAAAMVSTSRV